MTTEAVESCPTCGVDVRRARTRIGRDVVLEVSPHLDGNVDLQADGVAVVMRGTTAIAEKRRAGLPLFREHECGGPR